MCSIYSFWNGCIMIGTDADRFGWRYRYIYLSGNRLAGTCPPHGPLSSMNSFFMATC